MKRVVVFEYVTGGGLAEEPLPTSLLAEGSLMAGSLIRDLATIPGIEVLALRDERLPIPENWPRNAQALTVGPLAWPDVLAKALQNSDAAWPIAPESGGVLQQVCELIETAGMLNLGNSIAAVRLASSKSATARILHQHGIPVVPTAAIDPKRLPPFPCVVKPDDGAGCEGSRIIETTRAWSDWLEENATANFVVQPRLDGEALSLSAIFANGESRLLAVNRQRIGVSANQFRLKGLSVNAIRGALAPFARLTSRIATAVPELWGYAGIDLIDRTGELTVLEINPRLTSAYAGLAGALSLNPAALVIELWQSGKLPDLPHRIGKTVELTW